MSKRILIALLLLVTAPFLYSCKSVNINDYMLFSYLDDKDNVRSNIRLFTNIGDYAIIWSSSNDDVVSRSGEVNRTNKVETVILTAKTVLKEVSFKLKVLPLTDNKLLNLYPNLSKQNHFLVEKSNEEVLEALNSKDLKVIYLGFPSCSYCREYFAIFYDVSKDLGIKEIIYNDIYSSRIKYEETKSGFVSEVINFLKLNDTSLPTKEVNGEAIDWLFAPTFIIVNEGEIRGFFTGAIEGHDASLRHLNRNERNIFINDLAKMINYALDKNCGC